MLTFYPTNNAFDIKLKGSPEDQGLRFIDKGYKTAPSFFVTDVMPVLMKYIHNNFDVTNSKLFWKNLAQKGLDMEEKASNVSKNTRSGSKCGHCQRKIGKKGTVQCRSCFNINLVECITDISES